jgi:uncharacterized protein
MRFILALLWMLPTTLSAAHAAEPGDRTHVAAEKGNTSSDHFLLSPVQGYQKHISPVLGGKCPMHPSCSNYCAEAVKKHGVILGWIMTCDRLMRCGRDELNEAQAIRVNGQVLCDDPVSNNDFWLKNHPR